jgi:quercetin dioxygenase-like cupin family protein
VGDLRRGDLGADRRRGGLALPRVRRSLSSPFGTWNGVELFEFVPGVHIHAAGGEQALVCRVNYDPGFGVPLHSHQHTEQIMVVTEGDLVLTVAGETKTLGVGDWAVINRGIEHSVRTVNGCQFIEALSPVPLDHVPNRDRDLVLGPDGGSQHVER